MSLRHPQVEAADTRERQRAANEQRAEQEALIAAAPPLTEREEAELARVLAAGRGWTEHSWLWTRAVDLQAKAEAERRYRQREEAESEEAEAARWVRVFEAMGADPLRQVTYAPRLGQRGRRVKVWPEPVRVDE